MTARCKHVEEIKATLRAAGATEIRVARAGRSVRIAWCLLGRASHITTASHPRDAVSAGNMGCQRARCACREVRA